MEWFFLPLFFWGGGGAHLVWANNWILWCYSNYKRHIFFHYLLLSYNYETQGLKQPFCFGSQFCGKEFGWLISDAHGVVMAGLSISKCFHHSWLLSWFTLPLTSPFLSSLLIFCLCLPLFFILSSLLSTFPHPLSFSLTLILSLWGFSNSRPLPTAWTSQSMAVFGKK